MGILVMIGQFLLCISVIVGLHELGHLLAAKLFKMRVERYSIGFPPRLFGFTWGGTDYCISALPLGGYVKISGMIDESLDTKNMSQEPEEWEFRAKPAWQRLIVMVGGVVVNVVTGIMMFVGLVWFYGESYLPTREVNKHGIVAHPLAQAQGLRTGDKILKINGKDFENFADVRLSLLGNGVVYTVEREGKTIDLKMPDNLIDQLSQKNAPAFLDPIFTFSVRQVAPGTPAARAGLAANDRIVMFNGKKITYFHELQAELQQTKNKKVLMQVQRGSNTLDLTVQTDDSGRLGFLYNQDLKPASRDYGLAEATLQGTNKAFGSLGLNIMGIGKVFSGQVSANAVSGPIGIVSMFPQTWDWYFFWSFTAMLSMWLAFLNILPIPALDGGHVVFLLYEMLSGRKPSEKIYERAQIAGMVLLLSLMVLVFGNDILKFFR